jgi:malonyl-CoA/methylmalonyl-CoA synthetase
MNGPYAQRESLPEHFRRVFSAELNRVALELPNGRYRYGEILEKALVTAGWFRKQGVRPGDRVAVHMSPNLDSVLCYLASLFYGTILVPLNPRYTAEETEYFLEDAEVRLFLCREGAEATEASGGWRVFFRPEGSHLRQTGQGDSIPAFVRDCSPHKLRDRTASEETALLCYTSGTTGRPKGAMITQANLACMAASLHKAWGWSRDDVLLHALPLFHVHGLLVALQGALYAGARIVLMPRFEARETAEQIARKRATLFMGVPTMYRRLVSLEDSRTPVLEDMRLFVSGSAPLPADVFHAFQERFGHTVLERYGMTEAGMVLSNPLEGDRRPGSVGLPLPGVSVRIVDPETNEEVPSGQIGELLIRSGSVCKGYWRRPEATKEAFTSDGWLRSGDVARQDEAGYFTLVARRKEIIISGGFNVYPKEVETVLERHPAVVEAAVFGATDTDLGEQVRAAVVPAGEETVTEQELIRFCKTSLTSYKCPRKIRFLDDLPRNPMGKVVKERLKDKG